MQVASTGEVDCGNGVSLKGSVHEAREGRDPVMRRVTQLGTAVSLALASPLAFAETPQAKDQAAQEASRTTASTAKENQNTCVCPAGAPGGEPEAQGGTEERDRRYASERARQNALAPWLQDGDVGGR